MKIGTRQLIFRLTAAAIGLAATCVVFGVAHSQEARIVLGSVLRNYEAPTSNEAVWLSVRQGVRQSF